MYIVKLSVVKFGKIFFYDIRNYIYDFTICKPFGIVTFTASPLLSDSRLARYSENPSFVDMQQIRQSINLS